MFNKNSNNGIILNMKKNYYDIFMLNIKESNKYFFLFYALIDLGAAVIFLFKN